MPRPAAIIFVQIRTSVREVYGGEKSTVATARALAAAGHPTHFILTAEDDLAADLTAAGLTWEVVPVENPFDGLRRAAAGDKLRRVRDIVRISAAVAAAARRLQARVIHTSGGPAFMTGWLGARLARAKVVYHVRGASTNQRTRGLEEAWILLADRTVAVSPSLREQLVGTARRWLRPLLAPRVQVINNGFDFVEIDRFMAEVSPEQARALVGPAPERPSALFVGGIWPDKGQLRFLERVLPAVVARLPDFHVSFVGGVKDAANMAACERAVAAGGLGGAVTFTGYKPLPEVFTHYRACDLVVLASEREGLPRTAIEAQGFARPIVATACVGSTDAIRDGRTGFLVANDRVEDMVEPIVRLARDAALRRSMGEAGAAWVRSTYTIEANARAMSDLVRGLL